MTEMNELTRSLDRVEELIHQESIRGALTQLNIAYNHALTAVKLIKDQAALLTKQQLEIITLIKDVEIQKERADMQYKRAVSAEAEIKELDEQVPAIKILKNGKHVFNPEYEGSIYGEFYARPVPAKRAPDDGGKGSDQ